MIGTRYCRVPVSISQLRLAESGQRSANCELNEIVYNALCMMKQPFQELHIWQKGIDLVDFVYDITNVFPQSELYGLSSQCRRSAVSVPSNISEGSQRGSDKDFANFILIAKGSLAELLTQMIISHRRKYLNDETAKNVFAQIDDLSKMLYSFYKKLTADR